MKISPAGLKLIKERWRSYPGWEGWYEVSDQGQVRSIERVIVNSLGHAKRIPSRILKAGIASHGYLTVSLWRGNKGETHCVHVAVAAAFLGPCPEGMEVLHGSSSRTDNSACNLRYGTRKQNKADELRDGTRNRGERNSRAGLNNAQVRLLRRIYLQARPKGLIADLARAWGLKWGALHAAGTGKTWAWLTQPSYSS